MAMNSEMLSSCYSLLEELFLYPEMRDNERVEAEKKNMAKYPKAIRESIEAFLKNPASSSNDEYINTLELTPPCPLYLGTYLFDEPRSCRGAGTSGRNNYMMELSGIYNHYGFQLNGKELADHVPVILNFLSVSLERQECDKIGLRRRLIEHNLLTGLAPMLESMQKYESPYGLLVKALGAALEEDIAMMAGQPAWMPAANEDQPPEFSCSGCEYDFLSEEERKKEKA